MTVPYLPSRDAKRLAGLRQILMAVAAKFPVKSHGVQMHGGTEGEFQPLSDLQIVPSACEAKSAIVRRVLEGPVIIPVGIRDSERQAGAYIVEYDSSVAMTGEISGTRIKQKLESTSEDGLILESVCGRWRN